MSGHWHFTAHFETHEQAKQAAQVLRNLFPVFLHVAYRPDREGEPFTPASWEEYSRGHEWHKDVRV